MRQKIMLVLTLSIVALLVFACTPATEHISVDISCDEFTENSQGISQMINEFQIGVGGTITMTLCSNPTTGFQWPEVAPIADKVAQADIRRIIEATESIYQIEFW